MMSGAKGNSQFDATMGLLEVMQDPAKYKKKMEEFARREKSALEAEKNLHDETDKLVKAKNDLKSEEKRLEKDVKALKKDLEKRVTSAEKLETELTDEIQKQKMEITAREQLLNKRQEQISKDILYVQNMSRNIDSKLSNVAQREKSLDIEMKEIERIKSLLAQI